MFLVSHWKRKNCPFKNVEWCQLFHKNEILSIILSQLCQLCHFNFKSARIFTQQLQLSCFNNFDWPVRRIYRCSSLLFLHLCNTPWISLNIFFTCCHPILLTKYHFEVIMVRKRKDIIFKVEFSLSRAFFRLVIKIFIQTLNYNSSIKH